MNTKWAKTICRSMFDESCGDPASSGRWSKGQCHAAQKSARTLGAVSSMLVMLMMIAIVALLPMTAAAQALPTTNKGWIGLKAGTQPPSGLYVTFLMLNYNFDTLVTNDGTEVGGSGRRTINQFVPAMAFTYVSEKKLLGANYSATFALPLLNASIEFPVLDLPTDWGVSDIYIQPIQLGWHYKHADLVAGYALYMPTGRYNPRSLLNTGDPRSSNNTGLGQWSNEFSFGFTLYPSENKKFHLSTIAQYYIESGKENSDQKVGDSLQLQGGIGVSFKKGLMNAGMAYYTQWKMTDDKIPSVLPAFRGKNRYIGFGPSFDTALPISEKTPVFATFRYYFETGNRVATQGDMLFFGITIYFPPKH